MCKWLVQTSSRVRACVRACLRESPSLSRSQVCLFPQLFPHLDARLCALSISRSYSNSGSTLRTTESVWRVSSMVLGLLLLALFLLQASLCLHLDMSSHHQHDKRSTRCSSSQTSSADGQQRSSSISSGPAFSFSTATACMPARTLQHPALALHACIHPHEKLARPSHLRLDVSAPLAPHASAHARSHTHEVSSGHYCLCSDLELALHCLPVI